MSADADSSTQPPSPPVVPEYERRPIPFKGKASKEFVRRLIATGRYTVNTLDGTPITDWKRLFQDIHEPSAAEALDGDKPIPVADVIQPSPPDLATFEHLDSRYSPERGRHSGERRVVLSHHACS